MGNDIATPQQGNGAQLASAELEQENAALRRQLEEAQETIDAIHKGRVDAFLVEDEHGEQRVYTLDTADRPYRRLVECMHEAALTLTFDGLVLFCNERLAEILQAPRERVNGWRLEEWVPGERRHELRTVLREARGGAQRLELELERPDRSRVPVHMTVSPLDAPEPALCAIVTDLTEHKHYEVLRHSQENLRASEERLRLAAQTAGFGIHDRDIESGRSVWSEELYALSGIAPGTEIGLETWLALVHPEDRSDVEAAIATALDPLGSGEFDEEYRIRNALTGETRWVHNRARTEFARSGAERRAARTTGVVIDVTQRKRNELATQFLIDLDRAAAQSIDADVLAAMALQLLGDHLGGVACALSEVDVAAGLARVRYERGTTGRSVLGTYPLAEFLAPGLRTALTAGATVAVTDVRYDEHTARQAPDFARHGVAALMVAPQLDEGRLVATISAKSSVPRGWRLDELQLMRDVIARLWPALQRARAIASLRRSEGEYRALFDGAGTANAELELQGRKFVRVNQRFCELTGHSAEQLLGTDFIEIVHPDDRERSLAELESLARGRQSSFELEQRYRRRDGSEVWVHFTGTLFRDLEGSAARLLGAATDITARKQVEMALQEADRRKDEFLAMLAHELRNPLAPIRNAVQILRLIGPSEPTWDGPRDMIDRQVNHLVRLVDDLLDVSRVSRGKIQLQKMPCDLGVVVRHAIETSRPLLDARGHELRVTLPPEPVRVHGDFTRLTQVVANLLNNAAKYTDPGGTISVALETAHGSGQPEEAIVRVRDNGRGIDPAVLANLFELFYQADRNLDRAEGGLGIGLSLVKSLVDLHGGRVEALSDGRRRGSEFVVRLPRLRERELAPDSTPSNGPARSVRGLRILVVDDNPDSTESMALLLRIEGHEVSTAGDGEEAVRMALAERPDVVLLDIGLPKLDGYETCRHLRDKGLKDVLLVAVTGYGQEESRRDARKAGFDAHLVKPVELETLRQILEKRGVTAAERAG